MELHLRDFAHLVEGDDWTLALQEALHQCKLHPGCTLHLDGGRKHLRQKYAAEGDYFISNNDGGHKYIVFPIIGFDGLTIDGDGADLIFHGTTNPFVIDKSNDIVLRNFSVDYEHPFYFEGKIVDADEHHCEIEYDTNVYEMTPGADCLTFGWAADNWSYRVEKMLTTEFDGKKRVPTGDLPDYFVCFFSAPEGSWLDGMNRYLKASLPAPGRLLLTGELGLRHTVGNIFVCTWNWRYNPGILANKSRNILIEDVTLYHTAAMGIVGQLCENITLVRVKAVVRPGSGRSLTICADATHFLHCTGTIRMESCTFLNMLDDATNVHGAYARYVRTIDDHTILLDFNYWQQFGMEQFLPGDKVYIVDNRTMQPVAEMTVRSLDFFSSNALRLEFEEPLPPMREGYVVENFTRMPEIYINNCECGDNRPRGFLLQTRKRTEVTNCTFHNMCCGIQLAGDAVNWFESGPSGNVVIRNNRFVNAAYARGAAIDIGVYVREGNAPYHGSILIEDNYFEQQDKRFLNANYVEHLVVRNNTYHLNPDLPARGRVGEDGIIVKECPNAQVEPPKEV